MALLSKLKGSSGAGSDRAAATSEADPVQAARSRARRRLVGAAVLLGVGVIGFPILFETQPRPVAVDLPIDIPKKEGAPSLPLPPPRVASAAPATARVASGVIAERVPEAPRAAPTPSSAPRAAPTPSPAAPAKPAEVARPAAELSKSSAATAKATSSPPPTADGDRAKALLEGKPADAKADVRPEAPAGGRFVVQVAAYADMSPAREMRQRVEKLGLKSYLQTVEINGATRVRLRVGPFGSREEADKAAEALKAAGYPAAVLTL